MEEERKILSENMKTTGRFNYRIVLQMKGQYLIENNLVEIWANARGIDKKKITHSWSDYITLYTAETLGLLDYLKEENDSPLQETKEISPPRKRGTNGGRKKGLSREAKKKAAAAAKLYTSSEVMPISEIMEALSIGSKATLYRYLRYAGVEINSIDNQKLINQNNG